MATDGSLLGETCKWRACGWAVVQLDYDKRWALALEAELEVQPASLYLSRVIRPVRVHIDNKGSSMAYEKEKVSV